MLYAKINVKSNHFLFLTSLESPLHKGGSEGVWKYRWLPNMGDDLIPNVWSKVSPVITLALGYIFGKNKG